MQTINKVVYKCEYCGQESDDQEFMKIHEECCAQNPKNQPCVTCSNLVLGVGCSKRVDMECVGGNVICFYYNEGLPQTPFEAIFKLDGNHSDQ